MNQKQIKQIGRADLSHLYSRYVYGSAAILHFLYLNTNKSKSKAVRHNKKYISHN